MDKNRYDDNDERRDDGKDMLDDIIDDLSRENEFKIADDIQPDETRRPPVKKSGGLLWPFAILAIVVLAATWHFFSAKEEPLPAPPETASVQENDGAASQTGTFVPPAPEAAPETGATTEGAAASEAAQGAGAAAAVNSAASAGTPADSAAIAGTEAERKAAEEKAKAEAEKKAAEEKAKAEAEKKAAEEKAAAEADVAEAAPVAISQLWVVNISSTPDDSESLNILRRVMASDTGGQVYTYKTTVDGKEQNRIRVGFFESREEAEAAGQKLHEAHKLPAEPWAVQPTEEEVARYKK